MTVLAWVVAESADLVQHLLSFVSWPNLIEQLAITTVVVLIIAVPVARTMGLAHLELHRARGAAERLSLTDPMTGLANRRAFYEAAAGLEGGALALVIVDIDRFKRINDRYGHAVGDEVIKSVASRMQADLGDLGIVARLGGEEFALVGAGVSPTDLLARLIRFRQRLVDEPPRHEGWPVTTTVSIGFAARAELSFDALYAAADRALYVAKSAGRDRVVDFDEIGDIAAPPTLRVG